MFSVIDNNLSCTLTSPTGKESSYLIGRIGDSFVFDKMGQHSSRYVVSRIGPYWTCDCRDAMFRGNSCKHIRAAQDLLRLVNMIESRKPAEPV